MSTLPDLVETEVIEDMLFFARGTLAVLRCRRSPNQPPYIKIGRAVRYDPVAVKAWLDSRTVHPRNGGAA